MNDDLLKYLKPNDNDQLLKMTGTSLQDLLYYLDNFYLTLRDSLGIDENVTFGMELEFEQANREHITNNLVHNNLDERWKVKGDGSLDRGGEIATPVLKDLKVNWDNLSKVCEIVRNDAVIGEKAGGHIHIGTPLLGNDINHWLNFLKLWSIYENIIYRFAYGEYLTGRDGIKRYAQPMRNFFMNVVNAFQENDSNTIYHLLTTLARERYQAVNFGNVRSFTETQQKNTIEFRCPNGTLDPVIWQNNFNLFVNLLKYATSSEFNNDILTERNKFNEDIIEDSKGYNKIYLRQALELSDMLFNNNLDKIYFLRQYLKSYEFSNEPLLKAKPFTRH